MRTLIAARLYLTLTAFVIAFQIALAAGAPWGEFTMGGAYLGVLPPRMRVAAVGSALLLSALGAIVAARAGLGLSRLQRAARRGIWFVVAYTVVGVALNAATPSARERSLWLPVILLMSLCAFVVARAGPDSDPAHT
ncbi:MAG TPA: hypothetical protein VE869_11330 [Gemmatimonas sp.]|nr:hypothetical protein [Gemmatimonas sp.]